ncbi:hypothetical protein M441DRAFT_220813 [Trichoderma asperellum CBS 433.97]|uniref:Secreted protein n=1 Tax=Trichoderma asperellum (strain ATCC 204424 / CBS 433.97 / NBRC 101777) TaxID=1042311 RepID=A0A2T3ZP61_TRIA4|nr:hypothetical protein M441DRAFT_220813 [Trichoderma asperellum CBS 433.97]PTB46600.1 hypothetical protein M441DRAFT_220813 [Trichoderma asperellum CBS 433.97]
MRLAFIYILVSLLKIFTASGALVVSKEPAKCTQRVYVYIQIEIKEEKRQEHEKGMPARGTRSLSFRTSKSFPVKTAWVILTIRMPPRTDLVCIISRDVHCAQMTSKSLLGGGGITDSNG